MVKGHQEITSWLHKAGPIAVAASGGVDSMTLAVLAHKVNPNSQIFHAVSPAVPKKATERVTAYGKKMGWNLKLVDALEFQDQNYIKNPVNRCFYCKMNLYSVIAKNTNLQIVSGTNTDDLGDYRPGLQAAKEESVVHPWVESGFSKQMIRDMAAFLGLPDLESLPASPCLSSRVETGTAISPRLLPVVDTVESFIRRDYKVETVRCRLRKEEIVIELDPSTRKSLKEANLSSLIAFTKEQFLNVGYTKPIKIEDYRMGSAFVGKKEVIHG